MAGLRLQEFARPQRPDPMYTTCPNCTLILALTANDLRVGQGYVRCGRCGRVFNALISLTEEQAQETLSGATASGTSSQPAAPGTARTRSGCLPFSETTPGGVKVIENRSTGTFETIVLEGDSYTQTEEMVDQAEVEQQLQQIADRIDADELEHVREALRMNALDAMEASPEGGAGIDEVVGEGDVEDVVMETPDASEEIDADAIVGNRTGALVLDCRSGGSGTAPAGTGCAPLPPATGGAGMGAARAHGRVLHVRRDTGAELGPGGL